MFKHLKFLLLAALLSLPLHGMAGEIQDWDTAAANNNTAAPDGFPEGMAPSAVNNSAREVMAVLKRLYTDIGGGTASTGSANAYVLSASRTISAYAAGQAFVFEANHTNTGAATLNVDSVGAKGIKKNKDAALISGDVQSGQIIAVVYDAGDDTFQMVSPVPPPSAPQPPGSIIAYAGSSAPSGWLLCDGTTGLDSVADTTLAALFAVIGTTYGGTGDSDFDLPDMRGRVPGGLDNLGGTSANRIGAAEADILGGAAGSQLHSLTVAEMPAHTHVIFGRVLSAATVATDAGRFSKGDTTVAIQNGATQSTGSNNAHNIIQPSIFLSYIIRK